MNHSIPIDGSIQVDWNTHTIDWIDHNQYNHYHYKPINPSLLIRSFEYY